MKTNTKLLLSGLLVCGGVLVACGDSSGTGGAGGTTSSTTSTTSGPTTTSSSKSTSTTTTTSGTTNSSSTGMGFPTPPTLGTQIDRMGRPAINTAADETFLSISGGPKPSTDALRGTAEDAYNADSDPAHWSTYSATAQAQLAILDALDAPNTANPIGCGNQLLAGGATTAGTYAALANVLVADMLWVNTKATTTCNTYLGVEEAALGLTVNDCGGRRPADDVIKTTYTVVSGAATFDDGITDPGNHQATFPFLVAPH